MEHYNYADSMSVPESGEACELMSLPVGVPLELGSAQTRTASPGSANFGEAARMGSPLSSAPLRERTVTPRLELVTHRDQSTQKTPPADRRLRVPIAAPPPHDLHTLRKRRIRVAS